MKTAAVFFADGFEEIEGLTPVDYMRRAGINVIMVGVGTGLKTKQVAGCSRIITSAHDIKVICDVTLEEYLKEYGDNLPDCVVCPGGSVGAENLGATKELLVHLEKCLDAGKLTTAICASPAVVFGKTKITDGRKWTCYPGCEEGLSSEKLKGYTNVPFITDGNVVTGRGPGASEEFAMELVKILAGAEVAEKIHAGSQQR